MVKTEDTASLIKLIKLVEKNPCLWNYTLPEYAKRSFVDKTWNYVAQKMNDNAVNCRDRWTVIRGSFVRGQRLATSKGSEFDSKKIYYLSKHLEFLKPYTRYANIIRHQKNVDELTEESNDYTVSTATSCDITNAEDDRAEKSAYSDRKKRIRIKKSIFKSRNKAKISNDAVVEWINSKKISKKKSELDADQFFLNSLLPYLKEMTDKQNLLFRRKALKLIDDILDDVAVGKPVYEIQQRKIDRPSSRNMVGDNMETPHHSLQQYNERPNQCEDISPSSSVKLEEYTFNQATPMSPNSLKQFHQETYPSPSLSVSSSVKLE